MSRRRQIEQALHRVNAAIAQQTDQASMYSRGLAREGYLGGYSDALSDVLLCLNGVRPDRRTFWEDDPPSGSIGERERGEGTQPARRGRPGWRKRYVVWLQARLLNGEREWGARCEECGQWLTEFAATKASAWATAREHEEAVHGTD